MINDNLLIINITTEEYLNIWREEDRKLKGKVYFQLPEKYWNVIPQYLVAKCPICGKDYIEKIDTYSLRGWTLLSGKKVYKSEIPSVKCEHFIYVQCFLNINGNIPDKSDTEIKYNIYNRSEVPHILGNIMEYELDLYAVMHSLPICKIENKMFIPKYSLYMITYYVTEKSRRILNNIINQSNIFKKTDEPIPFATYPPGSKEADLWWNLGYWVEKGRLYWLDTNNKSTSLKKNDIEKFPYGNITGRKEPYFEYVPPINEKKLNRFERWVVNHDDY